MSNDMKHKYRMFRRQSGVYFIQDNETGRQQSLRTRNKQEAETLLHASNESHRQPFLNLQIARTYLMGADPKMVTRNWQEVMEKIVSLNRLVIEIDQDTFLHRKKLQPGSDQFLRGLPRGAVSHAHGCVHQKNDLLQFLGRQAGQLPPHGNLTLNPIPYFLVRHTQLLLQPTHLCFRFFKLLRQLSDVRRKGIKDLPVFGDKGPSLCEHFICLCQRLLFFLKCGFQCQLLTLSFYQCFVLFLQFSFAFIHLFPGFPQPFLGIFTGS